MSLAHVRKKVQGVIGREQPTGQTLLTSWDQLEAAMTLIWKNARDYNEDGSDIYNVSLELEVRLQDYYHQSLKYANRARNSSRSASQRPRPRSSSRLNRG